MHDSGGRDVQGQGARRSITAWALRRGSGVLESCHYWVFDCATGYTLNFCIKRAGTVRISAQQ